MTRERTESLEEEGIDEVELTRDVSHDFVEDYNDLKTSVEALRKDLRSLEEKIDFLKTSSGANDLNHLAAIIRQGVSAKESVGDLQAILERLTAASVSANSGLDDLWVRRPEGGPEKNAYRLSEELTPNKVMDASEAQSILGKSRPTAYKAMERLAELSGEGVVKSDVSCGKGKHSGKRHLVWVPSDE